MTARVTRIRYRMTLDRFDRAVALDDPATSAGFTWAYRADGQPSSYGQPDGNTTAYGYDAASRPASSATTAAGPVTRATYAWTRNRAGQVLSEATPITTDPTNGTRSFSYDSLARLTGFTDGSTTTSYSWDAVPNRTAVQVTGGPSVPTTSDAASRPLNHNGVADAFTSDADGLLTARPNADGTAYQRMTWDSLSRLTSVLPPTGSTPTAAYAYDPLDRLRMADYGTAGRVRFRYVGLTTSVAQTVDDASGSVIRSVGNGWTGEHLEDWTGSGSSLRVYGVNGHGDTTWTAGSTGSVTGTARYDPWGTATSVTGSVPDFRFRGSWADGATGLSWAVTRWYAPAQGRFISEDSLLGEPRDPDSRHLYAYGAGEPVGRWDPTGQITAKPSFDNSYAAGWLPPGVSCNFLCPRSADSFGVAGQQRVTAGVFGTGGDSRYEGRLSSSWVTYSGIRGFRKVVIDFTADFAWSVNWNL